MEAQILADLIEKFRQFTSAVYVLDIASSQAYAFLIEAVAQI